MRTSGLIVLLVVAACRLPARRLPPPPAPAADPPFRATSTIRELMQSMVAPSAQGLWDSVGRVSDAKGTRDLEPKSAEEWAAVRRHAVSLMESTNLLLIPGRHVAREGQQTLKADDAEPGSELPPAEIEKRINADLGRLDSHGTQPSRHRGVHARRHRQEGRRATRKYR